MKSIIRALLDEGLKSILLEIRVCLDGYTDVVVSEYPLIGIACGGVVVCSALAHSDAVSVAVDVEGEGVGRLSYSIVKAAERREKILLIVAPVIAFLVLPLL